MTKVEGSLHDTKLDMGSVTWRLRFIAVDCVVSDLWESSCAHPKPSHGQSGSASLDTSASPASPGLAGRCPSPRTESRFATSNTSENGCPEQSSSVTSLNYFGFAGKSDIPPSRDRCACDSFCFHPGPPYRTSCILYVNKKLLITAIGNAYATIVEAIAAYRESWLTLGRGEDEQCV